MFNLCYQGRLRQKIQVHEKRYCMLIGLEWEEAYLEKLSEFEAEERNVCSCKSKLIPSRLSFISQFFILLWILYKSFHENRF